MALNAAFIFIAPEADYTSHNAFIDTPDVKLNVVGVQNYVEAQEVAQQLVKKGITAIELCAGFGIEGTALIAKAVGDKAAVGVVRFDHHPGLGHQSGDKIF